MHTEAFTVSPYRYAKNSVSVQPVTDGSGWKTRASRLAECCGGRWVHRAGGYLMTPTKAARFAELFAAGWDGNIFTGERVAPRPIAA